ncbi:MAG TPA: MarR family transcriptional regulator [Coriobacteriia bacterium]
MALRDTLTGDQRTYIEKVGFFYEAYGLPRTVGRILGLLLIAEPQEQSLDEITDALSVAKSSVSTGARFLTQAGLIERAAVAGDRKSYYRMRPGAWAKALRDRLASNDAYQRLAEEGLKVISEDNEQARRNLREMAELYEYFGRESAAAIDRWEARQD